MISNWAYRFWATRDLIILVGCLFNKDISDRFEISAYVERLERREKYR